MATPVPVPAHVHPDLPLATDAALWVMGVALLVLAPVAYDAYRVYVARVAPDVGTDED